MCFCCDLFRIFLLVPNFCTTFAPAISDWEMKHTLLIFLLLINSVLAGAALQPSGTLPTLYITTTNRQVISSRQNYLSASYYLVGHSDVQSLGSSEAPLPLEIRGRGNWTWEGFDKKPYRIKLETKQSFGSIAKSKHWALLAAADDNLAYLRNPVGFWLSWKFGLQWTPSFVPIELVINDDYKGLYFLTETVRVDKHRVAITEQSDYCTTPDSITGGWLVEIDNYDDDGVLTRQDKGATYWITPHTPEELSTAQLTYLAGQWDQMNAAIYSNQSDRWEALIDLDEAARFYIVRELMNDKESYHGSCFLHKDIGENEKWYFGPVWDFGNAFFNDYHSFIFDNPPYAPQVWIGQLYTYSRFQRRVKELWYRFLHDIRPEMNAYVEEFTTSISAAAALDSKRWSGTKNYQDNKELQKRKNRFFDKFNDHASWLQQSAQWGNGIEPVGLDEVEDRKMHNAEKIIINGHLVIKRDNQVYDILGNLQ